jgi:hypothetical protein
MDITEIAGSYGLDQILLSWGLFALLLFAVKLTFTGI